MVSPDLSGGNGVCLLFILASDLNILHFFPGGIYLFFTLFFLLGHLSHSGDLLLWVGVRRRASCVVRRALTSSSQELLGQS